MIMIITVKCCTVRTVGHLYIILYVARIIPEIYVLSEQEHGR